MSWKATSWASEQRTGSTITKAVLWKLADNANDQGLCWPSVPLIADHCECSVRTIQEHLNRLESIGLIWVERRKERGVNLPNVYHLRMPGAVDRDGGVVQELHHGGGAAGAPLVQDAQGVVRPAAPGGAATFTTRTANEPPENRHTLAPAGAGEGAGNVASFGEGKAERWPEFRKAVSATWPGGFPVENEIACKAEFARQSRVHDPDLIITCAGLHGTTKRQQNDGRGKAGAALVKLPSNWLKSGDWKGYIPRAHEAAQAEAKITTALGNVRQALGEGLFNLLRAKMPDASLAMLDGLQMEPPARFLHTSNFQRTLLERHDRALEAALGERPSYTWIRKAAG